MAGRWDGTLVTVVPASGAARPTVMDWRIQIFCLIHCGCTGDGSFWGAGSCYGSGSSYTGGSVTPSSVAPAARFFCRATKSFALTVESRASSSELCGGGTFTHCGRS